MCVFLCSGKKVGNVLKTFFFFSIEFFLKPQRTALIRASAAYVQYRCWCHPNVGFPVHFADESRRRPRVGPSWDFVKFVWHMSKQTFSKKHPCTQKKYLKLWVYDSSATISLRRLGSHRYSDAARQSWINWVGGVNDVRLRCHRKHFTARWHLSVSFKSCGTSMLLIHIDVY